MKHFRIAFILSMAFLMPALMNQAQAQKKITLKYKLHQGETFTSTSNIDQDIEMHVQGQVMTLNQIITNTELTKIAAVNPNSIQTSNSIEAMTMKQTINGQEFYYDSSDPTTYASGRGKQVGDALNKVIHKTYGITIDELGNITNFDLKNLLAGNNKLSSDMNAGNNFIIFPDHKVKTGDSWEADIKPMKGSNMKIHMKYTLKKIAGKKATLGLEGTITGNDDNETQMNISGTQSGEAIVDLHDGWTLETNLDQDVKMEVTQNGMTIPMNVSSTITKKSKIK